MKNHTKGIKLIQSVANSNNNQKNIKFDQINRILNNINKIHKD